MLPPSIALFSSPLITFSPPFLWKLQRKSVTLQAKLQNTNKTIIARKRLKR